MSAELENTINDLPSCSCRDNKQESEAAGAAKPQSRQRARLPHLPKCRRLPLPLIPLRQSTRAVNAMTCRSKRWVCSSSSTQARKRRPLPAKPRNKLPGRVVAISELGVVVDIGTKREGLIAAQEFADDGAAPLPAIGETVEVERSDGRKRWLHAPFLPAAPPARDLEEN